MAQANLQGGINGSQQVREFLLAVVAAHKRMDMPPGIEEFVLKHGRTFRPGRTPRGTGRGEPQQCFQNASATAEFRAGDGWLYVEGYAAGSIPVLHAWICRPQDDLAIEVTWPEKYRLGYFGVAFRLDYVLATQTDECGSLLDRWREDWPLVCGQVSEATWKPAAVGPAVDPGWRYFPFRQIREAKAWAARGGVSVHDTGMTYKGHWACHLFAQNTEALRAAARAVGCQLKWIQYQGADREHYDLFAGPLQKALARCPNRPAGEPKRD